MPTEIGASEENIINRKQLVTKYKYEQMSIKNAYVHKDEPKTALCTDGAYLYLYSSIKGLFKLGTGIYIYIYILYIQLYVMYI